MHLKMINKLSNRLNDSTNQEIVNRIDIQSQNTKFLFPIDVNDFKFQLLKQSTLILLSGIINEVFISLNNLTDCIFDKNHLRKKQGQKFKNIYRNKQYLNLMNTTQSKSKTSLAYARSGKALSKPKNSIKNSNHSNSNSIDKNNAGSHHDNDNGKKTNKGNGGIYESIMGQIDSNQQSYIKSLIIKNQKEEFKSINKQSKTNANNKKQAEIAALNSQKRIPANNSIDQERGTKDQHQRTKSQTQMLKQIMNNDSEEPNTQVQPQQSTQQSLEKQAKSHGDNGNVSNKQKNNMNLNKKNNNASNPSGIFTNVNNARNSNANRSQPSNQSLSKSASHQLIAKKQSMNQSLTAFEQNPYIRQERETHKKVGFQKNKTAQIYYSCQVSPKSNKHSHQPEQPMYTHQLIFTSNTQKENEKRDQFFKNKRKQNAGNQLPHESINHRLQNSVKSQKNSSNFLFSLDEYLEALNHTQNQGSTHPHIKHRNSQPDTMGEGSGINNTLSGNNLSKNYVKILQALERERQKVKDLKIALKMCKKQITRHQKKELKLKSNQYEIIECLKGLNEELNEEKKERRKLEEVIKVFSRNLKVLQKKNEDFHNVHNKLQPKNSKFTVPKSKLNVSGYHKKKQSNYVMNHQLALDENSNFVDPLYYEDEQRQIAEEQNLAYDVQNILKKFSKNKEASSKNHASYGNQRNFSNKNEDVQYDGTGYIRNEEEEGDTQEQQDQQEQYYLEEGQYQQPVYPENYNIVRPKRGMRKTHGNHGSQDNLHLVDDGEDLLKYHLHKKNKKKQPNFHPSASQSIHNQRQSHHSMNQNLNKTVKIQSPKYENHPFNLNGAQISQDSQFHLQSSDKTNKGNFPLQNNSRNANHIHNYKSKTGHLKNNSHLNRQLQTNNNHFVSSFHDGLPRNRQINQSDIDRLFQYPNNREKDSHLTHKNKKASQIENIPFYSDLEEQNYDQRGFVENDDENSSSEEEMQYNNRGYILQ